MAWQERLWGWLEGAGNWPEHLLEMVCMMTALPFFIGALVYGYFPFLALGAIFTAVAWLAEERRLGGKSSLLARTWKILKRSLTKPWWTAAAVALVVAGVWREAVWIALLGIVILRLGVRRKKPSQPADAPKQTG